MDKWLQKGGAGLSGLLLVLGMGWLNQQATATEQALVHFERSPHLSVAETSEVAQRPANRPAANRSADAFVDTLLASHNRYRAELNLPLLEWSDELAQNAQGWANQLAARGGRRLEHSQGSGEGENLWMGTAGYFSYDDMVTGWGDEQQYFRAGTFPNVSTTGNWADVGHYTQIIWRDTTHVGCALSTAGGNDILVCRYSPPGNYSGRRVY